jgi:phage/plasmid-like protein (TIGR03299 family)
MENDMAHEIVNEQIAYANEVPWHGIGAQLSDTATPEEFLKAAKLDWTVDLKPLKADVGDGEMIDVPGRFALVRSSDRKIMTVTGASWKPLQNADTLDFMTRYCQAGGAKMETAGALRDGQIVWGLARLAHTFEVRPGDKVTGYLLITSPHVVGQAIRVRTTTVRVVCANTMALAEQGAEVHYRQSHLTEFDVAAAKAAVEQAHEQLAECERRAKTLDSLKLTMEDAVRKVLVPVFLPDVATDSEVIKDIMRADVMPKKISEILQSIQFGPGATPDTGWGVLNGITHWADHVQGHGPESRMYRSWIGDYGRNKLKAEQLLFELAA